MDEDLKKILILIGICLIGIIFAVAHIYDYFNKANDLNEVCESFGGMLYPKTSQCIIEDQYYDIHYISSTDEYFLNKTS